ncbi:MAG: hypothetical protein ACR2JK_02720 [Geodermatophilaceae bacterium]
MHQQVADGRVLPRWDDMGDDLKRRVRRHRCDLLDALGQSVQRVRRELEGALGQLLDADQQRSAVQGEGRQVSR